MFKRSLILAAVALFGMACNLATFLPSGEGQAKTGDVLYKDDFSDPASGWDTWASDGANVIYHNGGLRITINQTQYDYWSRPGKRYDDVVISVDASRLAGPEDNDYGVLCRYVDQNNFYAFVISSDGYAGILKVKAGIYSVISGETMNFAQAIKKGDASNTLTASCAGSQLTLQVNGETAAVAQDADFASGEVGLMAGAYSEAGVDILFDNFVVRKN